MGVREPGELRREDEVAFVILLYVFVRASKGENKASKRRLSRFFESGERVKLSTFKTTTSQMKLSGIYLFLVLS